MEARRPRREYFDTGTGGKMPTSRGEAVRWWVPCQYSSVPRLLMATRLAIGPATLRELCDITGCFKSVVFQTVRNWVGRRYAEWTANSVTVSSGAIRCRVATLTLAGRKDLWRYGWVTRRLRFSNTLDAPLRTDMPEDPIEALRLYACKQFLRPAALALLEELLGWPKQNIQELGRHTGNFGATRAHLRNFRKAGFITGVDDPYTETSRRRALRWVLNDYGHYALDHHIDALRRASLASGYIITKDCEPWYPCHENSPCGMSITPQNPPKCEDCLLWRLAE